MVTMVPHSLTVGGLIVDPAAGIASVADLKGKTIAVSGSPVDKSYVILARRVQQADRRQPHRRRRRPSSARRRWSTS